MILTTCRQTQPNTNCYPDSSPHSFLMTKEVLLTFTGLHLSKQIMVCKVWLINGNWNYRNRSTDFIVFSSVLILYIAEKEYWAIPENWSAKHLLSQSMLTQKSVPLVSMAFTSKDSCLALLPQFIVSSKWNDGMVPSTKKLLDEPENKWLHRGGILVAGLISHFLPSNLLADHHTTSF